MNAISQETITPCESCGEPIAKDVYSEHLAACVQSSYFRFLVNLEQDNLSEPLEEEPHSIPLHVFNIPHRSRSSINISPRRYIRERETDDNLDQEMNFNAPSIILDERMPDIGLRSRNCLRELISRGVKTLQLIPNRGLSAEFSITLKFDKRKKDTLDQEYTKCAICLSDYEDNDDLRLLECCHRFHSVCIDSWIRDKPTCPLCKKTF